MTEPSEETQMTDVEESDELNPVELMTAGKGDREVDLSGLPMPRGVGNEAERPTGI